MAKLKLRPWKYREDEKMRLYWICSPFKDEKARWTVRAIFLPDSPKTFDSKTSGLLFDNTVEPDYYISEFPWGALPNLRVGRVYVDGVIENVSQGPTQNVFIPDFQEGTICEAFDIPIKLYDFFRNRQFGREKIWRFQIDDKIYFLPCLEIIRAFFASSKTLTNLILKPNGLDFLFSEENEEEGVLTVTLSHVIPKAIVRDEQVMHILWLYYNENARHCWESVYNNLFTKAIKKLPSNSVSLFSEGLPLEIKPPLSGYCRLHFTGVTFDNYCLIQEILNIEGFPDIPFREIKYSHATFRRKVKNEGSKRRDRAFSLEKSGSFVQDTTRRRVKTNTNQPIAEITPTIHTFAKLPNLKRQSLIASIIDSAQENAVTKETNQFNKTVVKNEDEIVSTDESYTGGAVSPIEFIGLKLKESNDYTGLEDFLKTIKHVTKLNSKLSLAYKIYDTPGNAQFCFRNSAVRRNLIIVYVYKEGAQPVYIIEVSRHDEWAVSTLLIQFHPKMRNQSRIEEILLSILKDMIENNGHWRIDILNQSSNLRFIRIKHFKEISPQDRAVQIIEKLWILGLM